MRGWRRFVVDNQSNRTSTSWQADNRSPSGDESDGIVVDNAIASKSHATSAPHAEIALLRAPSNPLPHRLQNPFQPRERQALGRQRIGVTSGNEKSGRRNLLELAMEISLTSLGSSQTLFLPQPRTEAASLFWSLRETMVAGTCCCATRTRVRAASRAKGNAGKGDLRQEEGLETRPDRKRECHRRRLPMR